MSKKQIQIVSVKFGILSFVFGCYYFQLVVSIQRTVSFAPTLISFANLRMMMSTFVTLHFVLSSALLFTASVSSFGIYKLRRWGRLLAIIALTSYMLNFLALIITQVFSPFFDRLIFPQRSWFIFYHMNLRIDTVVVPVLCLSFLVLYNLKVFKKNFMN